MKYDIMTNIKTCSFIGHRCVKGKEEIKAKLNEIIHYLITKENVSVFYFGSKSEFDDISHDVVTSFQEKHKNLKRICVTCKSESVILKSEKEKFEKIFLSHKIGSKVKDFDEKISDETIQNAGKNSYIKRNEFMIDKSDFCVFYYDKNYIQTRQNSNTQTLKTTKSGTEIAHFYALSKKKTIINVFDFVKSPHNFKSY